MDETEKINLVVTDPETFDFYFDEFVAGEKFQND